MKKSKKVFIIICAVTLMVSMFCATAYAAGSGDVAGTVEGTWKTASQQIKTVVNSVVFPQLT